jgi:protein tyrosine/serine phosphatase
MRAIADVLYNFHWIIPGEVARSAQAYAGFLRYFLRRHGIRSVINLRGWNPRFGWWHYEKRVTKRDGIAHIDVKMNSRNLPSRKLLLDLLDAFDAATRPLLLKCSGGQDRTSFAASLYLIHRNGWEAMPYAMNQFARWPYLHLPKRQQQWIKHFPVFAAEEAGSKPLRAWITGSYSPERLKLWLETRGLQDSFRAPANAASQQK